MSSKLDKSAIVAGAGLAASIFIALVKKVLELGGTDEDIHRLATPDGETILGKVAEIIVGKVHQAFKVVVDYTKTLKEMVLVGKYDWVNENITQDHFPIQGSGKQEVQVALFHFGKIMASDQIIAEMEKQGYRSTRIEELLALGASQLELQRQFPIVALGSVWRGPYGDRGVPVLDRGDARRRLGLHWLEHEWHESYRFAAVRNA